MRRWIDIVVGCAGYIFLLPLLGLVGLFVLVDSGWPVVFTQERMGKGGKIFRLYKFRTMRSSGGDSSVTGPLDARVTDWGRHLRRLRLDELMQLVNVIKGEMSLVGPRPELPKFVARFPERWQGILVLRPGLTDGTTLVFRNEGELLRDSMDLEGDYAQKLLPRKLTLYERYVRERSDLRDIVLLAKTIHVVIADNLRPRVLGRVPLGKSHAGEDGGLE